MFYLGIAVLRGGGSKGFGFFFLVTFLAWMFLCLETCDQAWGADFGVVGRWDFSSAQDGAEWKPGGSLKDVAVADGKLKMTLVDKDGYLFSPRVDVPIENCFLRVGMKCDQPGSTEVFWVTNVHDRYGPERLVAQYTVGSRVRPDGGRTDGFITAEIPIGNPSDAGSRLRGFRLDPYNGVGNVKIEIDYIELVRKEPVIEAHFSTTSPQAVPHEQVVTRFSIRQLTGAVSNKEQFEVVLPGLERRQIFLPESGWIVLAGDIRFPGTGVNYLRASMRSSRGKAMDDLETSVVVGRDESLPHKPILRSKQLRVDLIATTERNNYGAAKWQIVDGSGALKTAGLLLPLGQVSIRQSNGCIVSRQFKFTEVEQNNLRVRLKGIADDLAGWEAVLDLRIIDKDGLEAIDVRTVLHCPEKASLLSFSGPVLRAGDGFHNPVDRYGILGGLEFLEPGWSSSSERAIGKKLADRWSPHPFKVALPLMAVEAEGITTALMWHPMEKWDGVSSMPTATFASPNFIDGQANHLMHLSLPSIPEWKEENESFARRAYVTSKAKRLSLHYVLYAESDLPAVMASRRWYEIMGLPEPPSWPHDDKKLYDLFARHYGETIYYPEDKGWRGHWFKEDRSRFVGYYAGELISHGLETGDGQWVDKLGLTGQSIVKLGGLLANKFKYERSARRALSRMRCDGTWAFYNTVRSIADTSLHSGGSYHSLGQEGSTCLGTCVQNCRPILDYALISGDKKYIEASIKILEAMKRFRVPRGAQTWEVHKDIPDIRAAALAVNAYHTGYKITGDRRWLDEASYWANTGLPFLYSWRVPTEWTTGSMFASPDGEASNRRALPLEEGFENPDRQVTPFGCIPVLGPTYYVIDWYGVMVQWCGLEWARYVLELNHDKPDGLLRHVAEGVLASGFQQMLDRAPYTGLFPDVWNTFHNQATGPYINASIHVRCMKALGRVPVWNDIWTRVLGGGDSKIRWHVSGWGAVGELSDPVDRGRWRAKVRYPVGQPNELIVVGADKPQQVQVADKLLRYDGRTNATLTEPGWQYDSSRRAVIIYFVQADKITEIGVDW
ncbi:MAG: hypothetical protein ACYTA5_05500 [Planctomycetota bacterium]|jgi:hypothetical protein